MADDDWGEPRVKLLRTIAAVALVILLGIVVIRDAHDTALAATIMGGLLVALGYEAIPHLPGGKQ